MMRQKVEWVEIPAGNFITGWTVDPDYEKVPRRRNAPSKSNHQYEAGLPAEIWEKYCKPKIQWLPTFYISRLPSIYFRSPWSVELAKEIFTRFPGTRLPTFSEWEKAARGTHGQMICTEVSPYGIPSMDLYSHQLILDDDDPQLHIIKGCPPAPIPDIEPHSNEHLAEIIDMRDRYELFYPLCSQMYARPIYTEHTGERKLKLYRWSKLQYHNPDEYVSMSLGFTIRLVKDTVDENDIVIRPPELPEPTELPLLMKWRGPARKLSERNAAIIKAAKKRQMEQHGDKALKSKYSYPTRKRDDSVLERIVPPIEWIEIPGGEFVVGWIRDEKNYGGFRLPPQSNFPDGLWDKHWKPQIKSLPTFYISRYCLSYLQVHRRAVDPTDCILPLNPQPATFHGSWDEKKEAEIIAQFPNTRLPTIYEWEKAARGTKGMMRPKPISPYGVHDMGFKLQELTTVDYPDVYALKGSPYFAYHIYHPSRDGTPYESDPHSYYPYQVIENGRFVTAELKKLGKVRGKSYRAHLNIHSCVPSAHQAVYRFDHDTYYPLSCHMYVKDDGGIFKNTRWSGYDFHVVSAYGVRLVKDSVDENDVVIRGVSLREPTTVPPEPLPPEPPAYYRKAAQKQHEWKIWTRFFR